ncbi:MAG: hypothetical protein IKE94_05455 [Aeriscardovia sp.]|nr:hypothetical protein [Aeriscardovia sp.]
MAYNKTTWANGDVITAQKLNNAENGIAANAEEITGLKSDLAQSASIDSSGLISFKNDSNVTVFTLQLPIYNGGVG